MNLVVPRFIGPGPLLLHFVSGVIPIDDAPVVGMVHILASWMIVHANHDDCISFLCALILQIILVLHIGCC